MMFKVHCIGIYGASKCLLRDVGHRKTYLRFRSMRLRFICDNVRASWLEKSWEDSMSLHVPFIFIHFPFIFNACSFILRMCSCISFAEGCSKHLKTS